MNDLTPIRIFLLLFFTGTSLAHAQELYLFSETGDYIGQAQEISLNDTTHTFSISQNFDNGVSVQVRGPGTSFWNLNFSAPGDNALEPGLYRDAIRYPLQPIVKPGLSVSGEGRGCNSLTGRFDVIEVVYNPDGSVDSFAADFEQHCEDASPALHGGIRYNSNVPVNISVGPVISDAGPNIRRMESQSVTLDGKHSRTTDGSIIETYQWRQLSGPSVELLNGDAVSSSFIAPIVPLGGSDFQFELTVTNSSGENDNAIVDVNISSKSDAQTFITMNSEPGDYIGQGQTFYFSTLDGSFTLNSNSPDVAALLFQSAERWNYQFAAPDGTELSSQFYQGASRYPIQAANEPGLNVSGAGRGCSTLTGNFDIKALNRDMNGNINGYAASFEQRCGGSTSALTGEIRFNDVDPSVPTADAGADQTVTSGDQVGLSAMASIDSDGQIMHYQWRQLSGPIVELSPVDSANPVFVAPYIAFASSETFEFEVVVTDD